MGFSEAVRTCLKLKYATFQGRASRSEYWYFVLFVTLVALALSAIGFALIGVTGGFDTIETEGLPASAMIILGILGIFYLAMVLPSIAVLVRRLHDRNLSGWWYLASIVLGLIPFVGFLASIALIVVTVLKGTEGPNKFGRDPLGPEHSADVFN